MLTDNDRREIDELIAQKLDIMSAFQNLPADVQERFAIDIEPFLTARQKALRKPENTYTPRWTVDDADINTSVSGSALQADQRGHAGPTLPRWIDMVGADGWLDPDDPQMLHIRATGGAGADCMFDYLVSPCWADEVAAGRGAEGQEFSSLTGCTFIVYSTIQAAITAADAVNATRTIFICDGNYGEDVTIASTQAHSLDIIGAGRGNVITTSLAYRGAIASNGFVTLQGMTIGTFDPADGQSMWLQDVKISTQIAPGDFGDSGTINFVNCDIASIDIIVGTHENWKFTHCDIGSVTPATTSVNVVANFTFDRCRITGDQTWTHCREILYTGCEWQYTAGTYSLRITSSSSQRVHGFSIIGGYMASRAVSGTPEDYIQLQGTAGVIIGFQCVGVNFRGFSTTSSEAHYINSTASAGIVDGANIANNVFQPNTASTYLEDNTGNYSSVNGAFVNSVIGPNVPGGKAKYTITGTGNKIGDVVVSAGTPTHNDNEGAFAFDVTNDILYQNESSGYGNTWVVVGVSGGGPAAPSPHNLVSTHHDGEEDYTNRLNLLGLGVSTGDVLVYSDAGTTQVLAIDGATGNINIGSSAPDPGQAIKVQRSFSDMTTSVLALTGTIGRATSAADVILGVDGQLQSVATAAGITMSGIHASFKARYLSTTGSAHTVNDYRAVWAAFAHSSGRGDVVDRYGLRYDAKLSTGTLTNEYVLYNEALNASTIKHVIHSLGGISGHVGAFRIGSVTDPTNVTDGDLTVVRLIVGDAAIVHSATAQFGAITVLPAQGALLFSDTDNSHYTGFKAHGTTTASVEYTWPPADGTSGYQLTTDGAGVLSWAAAGSGGGGGDVATDIIFDAKGDLAVGTGSDTANNLPVGADNTIIMADSAETMGLKYVSFYGRSLAMASGSFIN